jgi:DNA topoisomerase I
MSEGWWRRVGSKEDGFVYLKVDGTRLQSRAAIARIESLAIPPAWTDVRISPHATAKIQATGYDAAGRKQYRYHPDHIDRRARRKYDRVMAFAEVLPELRERTNEHLRAGGLGRERVLALVVRLMSRAFFRVGSERYAVNNRTYGIATLRKEHLEIRGNDLVFTYVGKGSVDHRRVVADTPLVEVIRELAELPGPRLFRYVDEEGTVRDVTAREVNDYLQDILGERYSSKDIRTWGGTVRAATVLAELGPPETEAEAKKNVVLACKLVSAELANTPAVCREAYIHPAVIEGYLEGKTIEPVMRKEPRAVEADAPASYYPEEAALLRFLRARKG